LAKPLSKQIKHEFSRYEATQRFLIGIGEVSHQVSSRLTIWSAGYRVRGVKALDEEKALKDGAEMLGESVIFLCSGTWMYYEYNKSNDKSKAKEDAQKAALLQERQEIISQMEGLSNRLNQVETALETTQESLQKLVSLQLYYTGIQPSPSSGGGGSSSSSSSSLRNISNSIDNLIESSQQQEQQGTNRSESSIGAAAGAAATDAAGRPWWRPW
jgi:optic atrophy 3 protein